MSLNMRAGFSSPKENASFDRKSDLIRSELAKYKMLKSKGGIINANDDIKENKALLKSNSLQTPSYQEASYRSALALVNSNSPQAVNTNNNTLKSDYSASSSKKFNTQSNQSFYSSVQPTAESYRGPTSHRDRYATENFNNYYSPSHLKDAHNTSNARINRNKSPTGNRESTDKKIGNRRSLLTEEKMKEKAMSQIEQFVNSELEKELTDKVYPKTAHHTTRNGQNFGTLTKTQSPQAGHSRIMKKVPSSGEIRVASAMEMTNKSTRETKNYTPVEGQKRKKSLPGSPKNFIGKDMRKKAGVSYALGEKERKTEGVRGTIISPRGLLGKIESGEENIVQEEIDKWRIFGKMMAESYDELNKKYTEYMKEKEKDKKVIGTLREQVSTLKNLLKEAKEENKHKEGSSKSTSDSSVKEDTKETALLVKEIQAIKDENSEVKKIVEFLKEENGALQHTLEESHKYKEIAEHYEKIAETRFKECSALAEEIICLRTDLDRSHSNYLRIQREQVSAKKSNTERLLYSGKKLRQMEQSAFSNNNSSEIRYKKWSDKKSQNWSEEADDQPPTPEDLSALPSKEENIFIRG